MPKQQSLKGTGDWLWKLFKFMRRIPLGVWLRERWLTIWCCLYEYKARKTQRRQTWELHLKA